MTADRSSGETEMGLRPGARVMGSVDKPRPVGLLVDDTASHARMVADAL